MAALAGTATLAARRARAQDTLKVAMIGNRGHHKYVLDGLEAMPDRLRLVGVADGAPDDPATKLVEWAEKNNQKPEVFDDYRKMLDTVNPDIVTVCGPFELHAQMCIDAFERGIPAFCEKLAATTIPDYKRLKAAQEKAGVHFAAMMNLRFDNAFYSAWRAVREGAIGEIRLVQAQKSYVLGNRGEYYKKRETSSGLICWVGSHAMDAIYYFCQAPFQRVAAVQSRVGNQGLGDLEMTAQCQFLLAGEIAATASLDYLRPAKAGTHGDDRIRVAGTTGVVEVRDGKAYLANDKTDGVQELSGKCDTNVFKDFVDHLQGKAKAIQMPQDVFAVTEACLLAREAADTGKIMTFPA